MKYCKYSQISIMYPKSSFRIKEKSKQTKLILFLFRQNKSQFCCSEKA